MYVFSNKSLPEAVQEAIDNGLIIADGQKIEDGWLLWDNNVTIRSLELTAKVSCPTDSHGARIIISSFDEKKSYPYNYKLSYVENRIDAAMRFAERFNPEYNWVVAVYSSIPQMKKDLLVLTGIRNND